MHSYRQIHVSHVCVRVCVTSEVHVDRRIHATILLHLLYVLEGEGETSKLVLNRLLLILHNNLFTHTHINTNCASLLPVVVPLPCIVTVYINTLCFLSRVHSSIYFRCEFHREVGWVATSFPSCVWHYTTSFSHGRHTSDHTIPRRFGNGTIL